MKSREVAMRALELSYAENPVVRYATKRVEEVGLGGLAGCDAIISAVDSFAVRAWLADASRSLGIPLIELGFSGHEGHVSVFPNQSADEPCWRCVHLKAQHGGFGCAAYARAVVAESKVPATQALAATFSSLAAEAAIQALHRNFPLAGKALHLDTHTGGSQVVELTPDPTCPGVHRIWSEVVQMPIRSNQPLSVVFDAIVSQVTEPIAHLPSPLVLEVPCSQCGAPVRVQKPSWALGRSPACSRPCRGEAGKQPAIVAAVSTIAANEPMARRTCRNLGLPIASIFEVEDAATGHVIAVQLDGRPDDLFVTKRRKARNAQTSRSMNHSDAATCGTTEEVVNA